MSRPHEKRPLRTVPIRALGAVFATVGVLGALGLAASPAAAAAVPVAGPTSPLWCTAHGAAFEGWAGVVPDVPICGPGPAYGGTWQYVDLPGPFGLAGSYYNATPGMQCVELAERFLAVTYGLAPVHANGAQVAMNYHAAYPLTRLYLNGTAAAVAHPPVAGDVVSFSYSSNFSAGDGHVAVVVRSEVNSRTGDGHVLLAQENVSSADYEYWLDLAHWQLYDPSAGGGAEFSYPYAEWLDPHALDKHAASLAITGRAPAVGTLLTHVVRPAPAITALGLGGRPPASSARRAPAPPNVAYADLLTSRVWPRFVGVDRSPLHALGPLAPGRSFAVLAGVGLALLAALWRRAVRRLRVHLLRA